MSSFDATHADPNLPDIDDRLATPGQPYEVIDGKWVHVAPADPPHAEAHADLAALIAVYVTPAFRGAIDMLTRTSETDDIAPDVSIYPRAPHPITGRRQLEHLVFEIVSTETLRHAGRKAVSLLGRGVRRVFAIDVERSRVLEWSTWLAGWSVLAPGGVIEDLVFVKPLPLAALLDTALRDDAVARVLIAKKNRVIEAIRARDRAESFARGKAEGDAEGHARGVAEGQATSIVGLLDYRRIALTADVRDRILSERDEEQLQRWFAIAVVCISAAELFA
jgi:hypothetical protein